MTAGDDVNTYISSDVIKLFAKEEIHRLRSDFELSDDNLRYGANVIHVTCH